MKISSVAVVLAGLFGTFAVSLSQAVPVAYSFVTTSGPTGGGTFTAQTSFDSSLFGTGAHNANPLTFSATLAGNAVPANNRTWTLNEVSFSQFIITAGGVLTFSGLQATDTGGGVGSFLNGGSTGFSSPVTIGGNWQQVPAGTPNVPDSGPGTLTLIVLGTAGLLTYRFRRTIRSKV